MKTRGAEAIEVDAHSFLELSLDLFCVADFDGYFVYVNPSWQRVLGFTPEELCARPFSDFVHPEDRLQTQDTYESLVAEGRDVIESENRHLCKNGTYKWLRWSARTLPERKLIYAVAHDVTQLRAAEAMLKSKNAELRRYNDELEDFTHVVSHDLKEPLRGITSFAGFLAEDYADKLDDTGRRYVSVLVESADRMRDLIDDLLTLTKVGRTRSRYADVDTNAVMATVHELLSPLIQEYWIYLAKLPSPVGV